ncbi:MAG: hypothetical protein OEW00_08335 [candidate division Zixibacteria bacterium]|nr:hypothetical protein [candidate division Zixibacteria bacterium]
MSIREQNLETIAPVLATFKISQTANVDDLKDTHIGQPVTLTGNNEAGPIGDGDIVLGKLISLTLTDNDDGQRLATVQIGGICRLAVTTTVPVAGDRVVGGASGTVKKAPSGTVPEGGHIGRGIVLEVNGTIDCVIFLS